MTCGIYSITNTKNGKRYIGSAADIEQRWRGHLYYLRRGKHHSPHLQKAWNKYGEKSFRFEIVAACDLGDLVAQEQFWIDAFQSADGQHGYNISPTAGSPRGVKHNAAAKARMSAAQYEIQNRPEVRAKKSAYMLQRGVATSETRAKLALARRGKKNSLEILQRMAVGVKRAFSRPEVKAKMSIAQQGRKHSDETRARMSAAHRGKLTPDDVRQIRELLADGCMQSLIAEKFGVTPSCISDISTGKTWSRVK